MRATAVRAGIPTRTRLHRLVVSRATPIVCIQMVHTGSMPVGCPIRRSETACGGHPRTRQTALDLQIQ